MAMYSIPDRLVSIDTNDIKWTKSKSGTDTVFEGRVSRPLKMFEDNMNMDGVQKVIEVIGTTKIMRFEFVTRDIMNEAILYKNQREDGVKYYIRISGR